MLNLKNVSKFYYNKGIIATGFNKVNLELKIGEFVVITGESGSGKSTLLNVISGIDSYEEGEMYIEGKETSHYTERDFEDYRRKYIANIFQSFNLINSYTVYQNVELVMLLNGYKKRKVKKKILEIIDQVGLTKFKNTKVSKLSGGQKQRVAIARAMVKDTPIIVADEPTGNLDTNSANEVIEILKKVAKNKLVIVVTHNIEQVEKYATRIVKMNDGRIVENTEIKKIEEEPKAQESEYKNISIINKMSEEKMMDEGYSMMFKDLSENRIIINKKDRTSFTQEEYEKIKNLQNIDYIVEDDMFLDSGMEISKDSRSIYGNFKNIETFKEQVDEGRLPENENEIVLKINRDNFYVKEALDEVLNKTFSVLKTAGIDAFTDEKTMDLTIVGIKYNDNKNQYNATFYALEPVLNSIRSDMNKNYSQMKVFMNNKYVEYNVEASDNVEKGKAVVDDELKYQYKNNKILKQPVKIYVNNIYYKDELDLTIGSTYTKSNFRKINDKAKYENNRYTIYINKEDYESLYNKPSYQSSVFVKDIKEIENTMAELNNLNIETKKVTDFKIDESAIYKRVIKIIKVIVTIILIVILFFISYLVIRLILKSRNIYYTTLRMLGATYKNVKRILEIELFVNSTISYAILMTLIYCIKSNIIKIAYVSSLVNYIGIKEYVIVYATLVIMARIISIKFARRLFKKTAINTYNEEV